MTLYELLKAATPGPWEWIIHDYSMASLEGPKGDEDHVLSVSPCSSCVKRQTEWEWGGCQTPAEIDARLIALGPDLAAALIDAERALAEWVYANTTDLGTPQLAILGQAHIVERLQRSSAALARIRAITGEREMNGMLHVYVIPEKRSNGYCFGGPVPITFGNVDWLNTPPDEIGRNEVEKFLMGKEYFTSAPVGTRFLVLCDDRPEMTFQMVKADAEAITGGGDE